MRGTPTMNIGACVGLKETLAANRPGGGNNDRYPLNEFANKNFFDGENFRAALERLDGGYEIATDFIELMQDYCDNEREQARQLLAYAGKWNTRLKQQSSLVSYHTTKRAQMDVVRNSKELARLKELTCSEIEKVIEKYRTYVNETYISERFRPGRKHRRTSEFKKAFKNAYAPLRELTDELESLRTQEKKARDALRTADSACEILELDPTTTEKQRARANDTQTKKRTALTEIEEKLVETKEKHRIAQKTYRTKATEIFKQCQYVEEERLDQIRETLLDFIQAMHTPKYSSELNQIFASLATKITTQQNSFDDLLFWAQTYGIDNKLTKSLTLSANEHDNENGNATITRSTKKSNHHEVDLTKSTSHEKYHSAVENNDDDDDEPSAPISNTVKRKVKRTRSTAAADKKTTHTIEPSTTNINTVLNRV